MSFSCQQVVMEDSQAENVDGDKTVKKEDDEKDEDEDESDSQNVRIYFKCNLEP